VSTGGTLSIAGRDVRVTNLDKILYPSTGTTKADVLQYYLGVAPLILEQLRDRPVSRKRWPDGVAADPFIEKNLPRGTPDWVPRVTLHHTGERSGRGARDVDYPLVDDVAVLVWLAQMGALELHAPQWRVDRASGEPRPPDRLVVDLDPGAPAGLVECAQVALAARGALEAAGLVVSAVTSGSKGMQLYADLPDGHDAVPAIREAGSVNDYAKALAERLEDELPELVVSRQARDLRPGRVLVDWSQNNPAKTTIVPWSLRGRERPTAATPVTWDEIAEGRISQRSMAEALALAEG
jgi:bifunctional non-homologous end joining protein LigD